MNNSSKKEFTIKTSNNKIFNVRIINEKELLKEVFKTSNIDNILYDDLNEDEINNIDKKKVLCVEKIK